MKSPSSTTVGAGRPSGVVAKSPRAGAVARQRKAPSSTAGGKAPGAASGGSMWRFYTGDDSPGIRIGPVPVLILSLAFIALVFLLHIWGKYTRG